MVDCLLATVYFNSMWTSNFSVLKYFFFNLWHAFHDSYFTLRSRGLWFIQHFYFNLMILCSLCFCNTQHSWLPSHLLNNCQITKQNYPFCRDCFTLSLWLRYLVIYVIVLMSFLCSYVSYVQPGCCEHFFPDFHRTTPLAIASIW